MGTVNAGGSTGSGGNNPPPVNTFIIELGNVALVMAWNLSLINFAAKVGHFVGSANDEGFMVAAILFLLSTAVSISRLPKKGSA